MVRMEVEPALQSSHHPYRDRTALSDLAQLPRLPRQRDDHPRVDWVVHFGDGDFRVKPSCTESYAAPRRATSWNWFSPTPREGQDRKSTRLNSSHVAISYAVFCLKKKKK